MEKLLPVDWVINPDQSLQCLMGKSIGRLGGPKTNPPPLGPNLWGLPTLIGSLRTPAGPFVSYKEGIITVPTAMLQSLDDPGISSEAQQVIDPFA